MHVAPAMRVTLDDGREITIQPDNRDLVRYDMLRGRKGWPPMQDAPFLWASVLAWSCLSREGMVPGQSVDSELDLLTGVDMLDDEGEAVTDADGMAAAMKAPDPTHATS